jgi:hemolysin activation/secretion protein
VSGADIFAAARDLESAYARAGFAFARVILPPQKLNDNAILHITVVDGYIERIDTKDLPGNVKRRITEILAPLVDKRHLTIQDVERRLLLAGDSPGVILRSTLAAGSATGATVLSIEARYQPVNGLVTSDNTLSPSLGTYTVGTGLDTNSILGLGETVYVRVLGYPNGGDNGFFSNNPESRILSAGLVLPLGANGVTLNIEGTQTRTAPTSTVPGLQSSDLFERLATRLHYAWVRSRQTNLALEAEFDLLSDSQTLAFSGTSIPQSQDRLRVLQFAAQGDHLFQSDGILTGRIAAAFGINGLGARNAAEATSTGVPLSRQGADAAFSKVEASVSFSQPILERYNAAFYGKAQYNFGQALLRSQQIGIAVPTGLSTFDSGTLSGDAGFVFRTELSRSFNVPAIIPSVGVIASPYVFGAVGEYFLQAPTAVEQASVLAASYGVGLKVANGTRGSLGSGTLALEYGFTQRNDGTPNSNRFSLIFAQRF